MGLLRVYPGSIFLSFRVGVRACLQVPTCCMAVLMSQTGYAVGGATADAPGQYFLPLLVTEGTVNRMGAPTRPHNT